MNAKQIDEAVRGLLVDGKIRPEDVISNGELRAKLMRQAYVHGYCEALAAIGPDLAETTLVTKAEHLRLPVI